MWQDPESGKLALNKRKAQSTFTNDVEAELAAMKRLADANPSIKKHVKFNKDVRVVDNVRRAEEAHNDEVSYPHENTQLC